MALKFIKETFCDISSKYTNCWELLSKEYPMSEDGQFGSQGYGNCLIYKHLNPQKQTSLEKIS